MYDHDTSTGPTAALVTQEAPAPGARAALRILQAGAVLVALLAVPFEAFDLDRFFVPKELTLHLAAALSGLVALGAVRRMMPVRADVMLLLFVLVSALSALFATNHWVAARALAITVSGVLLFWVARTLQANGCGRGVLAALAAMVVLTSGTALLQAYGLELPIFSDSRAPGGTLGNRNFVGHLAAVGLPILLLVLLTTRRAIIFLVGALGILLNAGALLLTRSRAAWLATAVVLTIILIGITFAPALRRDLRLFGRIALLLVLGGAGVAAAIVAPNSLQWRSDTPYLETARGVINYEDGSGRGRLIQYGTSLEMTLRHPIVGVGPGNWPVEYVAYASQDDPSRDPREAGMTANPWPSSDWVALLSERGPVAFVLFVLVLLSLAGGAWRMMRTASTAEEATTGLALLGLVAGTATVGAFDAVLLLAWPTFFFWTAAGVMFRPTTTRSAPLPGGVRVLLMLAFVLLSGAAAVRSAGSVVALGLYQADTSRASLQLAARLVPGNYRVHLRLARRGDRELRCDHALAARALYPNAAEARRLARRCD